MFSGTARIEEAMPSSNSAAPTEPAHTGPGMVYGSPTVNLPSFVDVYRTYFNFVWSITRCLGVDRAEQDDIVQEIFVIIYKRLETIEQPESLRSWIYGIIRRTACRYHRAKRTRLINTETMNLEPEVRQPEWCTPQIIAEQSEQVRLIWSFLEKIDAPKREVFILTEVEEMTAPEIAAAIGVPLNTVYSRLRAARQELDEALQKHHARTQKRGRQCPD